MDVFEHPYLLLGPLAAVQGPAAALTAGALVGAGKVAFLPVWLIVVAAEVTVDSVLYFLGRSGQNRRVAGLLRRLGLTDALREQWTSAATRSMARLVFVAKAVDVLAGPAFLTVGLAGVSYRRFLGWVSAASAARAALLIGVGATLGARFHVSPVAVLACGLVLALLAIGVPLLVQTASRGGSDAARKSTKSPARRETRRSLSVSA
ncbi:DedA family protein [Cryptosporangium phraense]|uniref:DedA family protein n=1 Tax=Cryptosporangium phraense TaxID=2593070 RepID=A0A545AGH6_9ACTN|nr:hypothetical protein [Cryptosporangium phraense]TQS40419.1 hypothetical protein FL583_34820 [Cryptosporangium phraense]